jgi:hypothetical protein
MITGFCFGGASTADQPLAETFFNLRANPNPRLTSVGSTFSGAYVADKSFEGAENHRRWLDHYGAEVIHPPKRNSKKPWSKRLRRWIAGIRQIVETVHDKHLNTFGLSGESGPMRSRVYVPAWRRGWRCTTSVSGSTTGSAVLG